MPHVHLLSVCGSAVCILQNSQSVQLWQLLLNTCYYVHSGAVVHVVADFTNRNATEKYGIKIIVIMVRNASWILTVVYLYLKNCRKVVNICSAQPVVCWCSQNTNRKDAVRCSSSLVQS